MSDLVKGGGVICVCVFQHGVRVMIWGGNSGLITSDLVTLGGGGCAYVCVSLHGVWEIIWGGRTMAHHERSGDLGGVYVCVSAWGVGCNVCTHVCTHGQLSTGRGG